MVSKNFSIKKDESITATDLPSGLEYTVSEKNENGQYVVTAKNDKGVVDGDINVEFLNSLASNIENPNTGSFISIPILIIMALIGFGLLYYTGKQRKLNKI